MENIFFYLISPKLLSVLTVFGAIGQTVNVPLVVVGAFLQELGQGRLWHKAGDRNVLGRRYCSNRATIKTAQVNIYRIVFHIFII